MQESNRIPVKEEILVNINLLQIYLRQGYILEYATICYIHDVIVLCQRFYAVHVRTSIRVYVVIYVVE